MLYIFWSRQLYKLSQSSMKNSSRPSYLCKTITAENITHYYKQKYLDFNKIWL